MDETNGGKVQSDGDRRATHAVLQISGMHCDACAALITETLDDEPAISDVEVRRDPDEVSVKFDASGIAVAEIVAVIDALEYTARVQG